MIAKFTLLCVGGFIYMDLHEISYNEYAPMWVVICLGVTLADLFMDLFMRR